MNPNDNSRKVLLATLAAILFAAAALAAPRLLPPSQYMHQERYRSVVAKIVEITEDGRFRLEVLERLNGETPDGLIVRGGGGLGGELEIGATYIIGHTDKPARRSPRWDTDPAGPRVLNVPAVGRAVFEDSAAMRTLVRTHPDDAPLTDRRRLDAVLEQVARPDSQSRRFVLAELAIDAALRELVGDSELEILRDTLASGELEPMAHDYLLRAARPMADSWGSDWLAADCRRLAADHGTVLDLNSLVPSLMVTALKILGESGGAADADLVARHVRSNNPGVGKAAFAALLALDRATAIAQAPELIADETLHSDVRRFVAREASRPESVAPTD